MLPRLSPNSLAGCFSVFSLCLTYCAWGLLSAVWKVVVPLNCGVCFPWVGLNQCLVKVSCCGGPVPVFWWMELDLVSLKGSIVSSGVFGDVYGFSMALGSLSANVQGCAPVLLKGLCGALGTRACWLLGGAWS